MQNLSNKSSVSVADGRVIQLVKGSKGFKWLMQGVMFQDDFLVLPIGSCDVVLGIQWLCKLGDIQINFEKLYMQFVYQGRHCKASSLLLRLWMPRPSTRFLSMMFRSL